MGLLDQQGIFIVTGGASGFGEATAIMLAKRSMLVAIFDLNEKLGKQLELAHEGIKFWKVDVTSEKSVNAALDEVQKQWPECKIAGLANSAGIGVPLLTVNKDGSPGAQKAYEATFKVNVFGTFNVSRLVASRIVKSHPPPPQPQPLSLTDQVPDAKPGALLEERGCIILLASTSFEEGQYGATGYSSSKGAVASLALPMARDLSRYGIRVVAVAPSLFATPLAALTPPKSKLALLRSTEFPPRFGRPDEVAHLIAAVFENSMLNGSILRIDGATHLGRL